MTPVILNPEQGWDLSVETKEAQPSSARQESPQPRFQPGPNDTDWMHDWTELRRCNTPGIRIEAPTSIPRQDGIFPSASEQKSPSHDQCGQQARPMHWKSRCHSHDPKTSLTRQQGGRRWRGPMRHHRLLRTIHMVKPAAL